MLIQVINPNTSAAMTALIGASARGVAGPGTRVSALNPLMGPASIESHYDEALAVPGLLDVILTCDAGQDPPDGYVIACFGDPGLDAARELARAPVVGIAEAAMRTASHLARSFAVVTTLERTTGRATELLDRYGLRSRCVGVRAVSVPVLALETDPSARERILAQCLAAVHDDGAEVVVLGCAGMADLCGWLSGAVGVPVVDGVAAAVVTVEGLVRLGVCTSRAGEFAAPPVKEYSGLLSGFALAAGQRSARAGRREA